ncbi:hypothetical protein ACQKNX_03530 [Lysinibacillus sp. NPDC093712]|uniref:hypothetical protein n=1 Tax=Lysinibacillus sp. NPDC093712 TaxID=3390579 RepID=UPI003CFE1176
MISGLLIGCTEEETKVEPETEKIKIEQVKTETEVDHSKQWKDVSTPEGFNNYGIEPALEAWIAYHAKDILNTTDVNEYYPRADQLKTVMNFQKDFENLNVL